MTRARTASIGVGDLAAIQPLLGAVLMLRVSLVQGARTTLGMICNRSLRDWRTVTASEVLPQARSGKQSQESNTTHGVILGLVPTISVGPRPRMTSLMLRHPPNGSDLLRTRVDSPGV
jgi:hypothetical protein